MCYGINGISVDHRNDPEAMMKEPFKLSHWLRPSRRHHIANQFLQDTEHTYSLITISSADAQRRGLLPRKIFPFKDQHYKPFVASPGDDAGNLELKRPRCHIDIKEIEHSERQCGILLKSGDVNPIEVIHAAASVTDWNDLQLHSAANVLIAQIRSLLRSSQSPWEKMNLVPPSVAKRVIDTLQWEVDYASEIDNYRRRCISCLQALSRIHVIIPTTCYLASEAITKDGDDPICGSASCDTWRGNLELERLPVCLKVLRYFPTNVGRGSSFKVNIDKCRVKPTLIWCLSQDHLKEVMVWRQVRHPRILPLLDVNEDLFAPRFCLISSWMYQSNIIEYLQRNPDDVEPTRLDFVDFRLGSASRND
ncbi:uncharacterized protein BT62DRAFT_965523 [Guyanagaster necrorhizus]|uniref:Protein kinase n=1 Tax=Guyanagaster necrorhizus TaxID=856835 RepID=A0A9P8AUU8_9AGAR|nr:uncharacterized protein BT62DRAFT_965523 [Guyanagaster necrorhizus MCA 3950]KAG7448879.1 hypothetical protein BT62DRAFT_965523 [Guyanagaster necrorhizus MCA 3950]